MKYKPSCPLHRLLNMCAYIGSNVDGHCFVDIKVILKKTWSSCVCVCVCVLLFQIFFVVVVVVDSYTHTHTLWNHTIIFWIITFLMMIQFNRHHRRRFIFFLLYSDSTLYSSILFLFHFWFFVSFSLFFFLVYIYIQYIYINE